MRLSILLLIGLTFASSCRTRETEPTLVMADAEETGHRLATASIDRTAWASDFDLINAAYASPLAKSLIVVSRRLQGVTAVDEKKPRITGFITCSATECDEKLRSLKALISDKVIETVDVVATHEDHSAQSLQPGAPSLTLHTVSVTVSDSGLDDLKKLRAAFATDLAKVLSKNGFHMGRSELASAGPELQAQLLTGYLVCGDDANCKTKKTQVEEIKGVQVLAFMSMTMGPVGNKAGGGSGKDN